MKRFRIKVDLSTFFDDERKNVYILVDPIWENVYKLQERVEQIFELENIRFITDEGCFIPPQEPIQVIKCNDVLKAFVPSVDIARNHNNHRKKHKVSINVVETLKKRKFDETTEKGFASSTPKRSKSVLTAKNSTVNEITSTNEQLGLMREKQSQTQGNSILKQQTLIAIPSHKGTLIQDQDTILNTGDVDMKKNKSKRKKEKKNKEKSSATSNDAPVFEQPIAEKPIANSKPSSSLPSSTILSATQQINDLSKKKQNECASHIYFNETGESVTTTTGYSGLNETSPKIIFRCPISDVSYDKPRVFRLNQVDEKLIEPSPCFDESLQSINEMRTARSKAKSPIIIRELIVIGKSDQLKNQLEVAELVSAMETETDTRKENERDKTTETETLEIEADDGNEIEADDGNEIEADDGNEKEEHSNETNNTNTEPANTTAADDSSVIAIESEYEDDSIDEEKAEEKSNEQLSEIIDLNASDDDSLDATIITSDGDQTESTSHRLSHKKFSIKKMLPFSTVLKDLPSSGEVVIFKLKNADTKISGYIAGKCIYTNKRLKNMKILVIDGHSEISGNLNQYICNLDDSDTSTNKKYMQIKMSEMIDAKLFQED